MACRVEVNDQLSYGIFVWWFYFCPFRTYCFVCNRVRRVLPWAKEAIGLSARLSLLRVVLLSHHNKNGSNRKKRMIGFWGCCIFAPWFKRESFSHKTFRPHTDMANSSVSHNWLHTKSQYLADNEGTKMGETRNRTGEYHDVGMLRARKYHIMKQQNPNISRWWPEHTGKQ